MEVTIILPVSRSEHLLKVFSSLEFLTCDRERTNILVHVDGDAELYLKARHLVENSKFAERLCVHGQIPGQKFGINARRRRIAQIHNSIREVLKPCDYVFMIEDDGILPSGALQQLMQGYLSYPHAGFITGVELGRWGIPHVGVWRADDVYEPREIRSALLEQGLQEIDAAGMYACLTKYDRYMSHEFKPYPGDAFGPDVEWGIWLRQQGYQNYINWNVQVEHCKADGSSVHPRVTKPVQMQFVRSGDTWSGKVIEA